MGYVEDNLLPGEHIVHRGTIHWFIFVPGAFFLPLGIPFLGGDTWALGVGLLLAGMVILAHAYLRCATTELAVTSKRVIAKIGFIRRNTIELNHTKVESFNIDQGIFGRIFGFGTVTVNGTGGTQTPIWLVVDPLDFRKKAMATIEAAQHSASPSSVGLGSK